MSIEHQTFPWFCRCCKLDWRAYSWEKVEKEGSVWWNILSIVGRLGSPRKWGIGFMFPPSQLAVSGRIQYHQHHDTSTGWFSALLLHPFKSLPPTPRALPMFSELAPTVLWGGGCGIVLWKCKWLCSAVLCVLVVLGCAVAVFFDLTAHPPTRKILDQFISLVQPTAAALDCLLLRICDWVGF